MSSESTKANPAPPRKSWFSCLVLLLALVCLGALTASTLLVYLPLKAEKSFGKAATTLGPVQHLYLAGKLLLQSTELLRPLDLQGEEQLFKVELGESIQSITNRLEESGLIRNAGVLSDFLVYAGLDTKIQAGEYRLPPSVSALQIGRMLQDATKTEVEFTVLPGWRREEIAAALPTSGMDISPESFLGAVSRPPVGYTFLEGLPSLASLEGFLFPGTYTVSRKTTAAELVAILLSNFERQVDAELIKAFERQGLDLFQAVTLASIIQREAVVDEEMPVIASVFFNRLQTGMKLETDPTVQYALGYNHNQGTWWTNPLSLDDLQVNSPYNTYQNPGLPPGPIANPGLSALKAVAYPAQTPYYYFRAACDGSGRHRFAETYEEHVQNACP
jgi:UPF0755 protein